MSLLIGIIRSLDIKKAHLGQKLIALVVAAVFGGGGVFIFTSEFLTPYLESKEAKNWVSIDATVIKSELKRNDDSLNIDLEYSYHFKGKQYQGDRFELSGGGRNFGTTTYRETAENYPKGSNISIWINPNKPEQSVFKRDMVVTNWIALPFSFPFLTGGLCALCYMLFNNTAFRIQRKIRNEHAQIASRYSTKEMHDALIGEYFKGASRSKISYLKHNHLCTSLGLLLLIFFVGGIVSVFVILNVRLHLDGSFMAYFLSLFLIPFVTVSIYLIYRFIRSLLGKLGEDYVILSLWDYEYTSVTHHWLLLSDHRSRREISFFTVANKQKNIISKLLKVTIFTDTFKTPDKEVISGTLTHQISGSSEKEINLVIHTKNRTKDKLNKHQITLYTPPND